MFGWLKKKTQEQPEAQWVVAVDENSIRVTDYAGMTSQVLKSELAGVIVETNDSGPWGADVWWLLFGPDDHVACVFPQGAEGEEVSINYLVTLPAFDHHEMIKAMRSTTNEIFPVWRRQT